MSSAHIRTASVMAKELDKGGGLDIHKKSVAAAIASEDGSILEAEFGMTIEQIYHLKKWLLENGCKRVLVESTASYWYRIDQVMRDEITVIVVNPRDIKSPSSKRRIRLMLASWLLDVSAITRFILPGNSQASSWVLRG